MPEARARLWLVRHGETDWNREGRYQGQSDIPLNATGLAQARALLPTFAGMPIAAIYSSDLQRAATTAELLGEALNLPVSRQRGLREARLGRWEGMLFSDIQVVYAAEWAERRRDPLNARPPGGESLLEVAARGAAAADEMARRHAGQQVIVVSHGLLVAALLCRGRGLPLAEAFNHIPANCSAELVEWAAG
ncbi:MAG: histidine phosphatase family protein [Anaerolineales bacterium]|nr:histidine phosphatase family protein [Anaerolineales bacterium]